MKEQYKHLLNFCANFIMLLFQCMLFSYIWYKYYSVGPYLFYRRGHWAAIGFYMLIVFFFTKTFNGYKIGYLRIMDICLSHILAIILAGCAGYLEICLIIRDYVDPMPLVIVCLIDIFFAVIWVYLVRYTYTRIYPPRDVIFIYGDYPPESLISKFGSRQDKYHICDTVSYKEGMEKIEGMIDKYQAVMLCDLPAYDRNLILKYCYRNNVRAYVTPKISDIIMDGADNIFLFDTPLLLCRNRGLSIEQRFIKRCMDILISLIGIILASPFMLIIAIAIKLYDHGPVFYKQERLTRDGKVFEIYKFRSMSTDSETKGARLAMKNDSRVTPVGKIIRNIHFDELPQLFNILKGEMSVVGPRPERQVIMNQYKKELPEFDFRLKVKAGLTGYAQVFGKYNTTPYDKLKFDMQYIENYSFWLDIKIMILTFKILFQKENTEGVDTTQITALKSNGDNKKE